MTSSTGDVFPDLLRDKNKQTPLFYAARDGRTAMCETLCSKGAEINSMDAYRQTALFYAAREGHVDTQTKLVELGADPTHRDAMRKTAAVFAKEQKHQAAVNFLTKAMSETQWKEREKEGRLGARLGAGGFGGRFPRGGMHMAAHPHPYAGAGGQRIDDKGGRPHWWSLPVEGFVLHWHLIVLSIFFIFFVIFIFFFFSRTFIFFIFRIFL
uniref:Uncharacterized protein n=1 Tax=Chromera velia CCMP2878 TaxID=1169474 RepID=A0A0G4HSC7_9ALVE|mmetsp:Transcript_40824/g.80432  ORF Transcript_40824/g.80432 Transcript_40824/m.80432 type:complete len:211 (+) Transcript_40824:146-778(+)|eukprot:Cvel_30962.t1-p1 / transcript=Cvel_30962.t1 / gene=Cvel_30962 / organism=Chromera_velia_CCMP2878 / gene_product=Ankyrin repeat, SAM and basic leucine zipper, putative / transcript_product=Ankyrin repeat, SAM and basic leucine zipper, putative / location=Cvel_scaffold4515:4013-6697(-) / protein_length=210 / sequence_SO=supercontig / SO=protein_coding / is_pseudo=false